jgi:hypothetical protein
MKQTAVEWLEIELIPDPISEEEFKHNINCWKQAKEMEKQQIMDAWIEGGENGYLSQESDRVLAEQYYNETFNINK